MRLWPDEMIAAAAARELRRRGHDIRAVQESEQRWAWGLEDEAQLEAAARQGRALVTYNLRDFVPLSRQWAEARRAHQGIVLIHPRTISPEDIGGLVHRLAGLVEAYPGEAALADRVVFLE
jgi:hypothetical protein